MPLLLFPLEARFTGKVEFYNKWKGYGFISEVRPDVLTLSENRIFVHWSSLQSTERPNPARESIARAQEGTIARAI